MSKDSAKVTVKIIKPRISKFCICPFCNTKQLFRKKKERWKTIKEINIDGPVLLKIQIVYAKCLNPNCERVSFPLPIKGVSKYQKVTARLIKETITSNILVNIPAEKIKGRFARSFNVTGSRLTLDRWKHKEADKLNFKDLIEKLKPSRVICLDPKRCTARHLITLRQGQKGIFSIMVLF